MTCERWSGHCESCFQSFWGPFCDHACSVNCECCDSLTGECRKCPSKEAVIVGNDKINYDSLNMS